MAEKVILMDIGLGTDKANTLYDKFAAQRERVQAELNKDNIKPVSFEVFKKTPAERVKLANAKWKHKQQLINAGLNPKKHMNLGSNIK